MQHDFLHSYRTLGIAPGAGWAEVKTAYRTKVRTWHPDRFAGHDEQKQFAEEQTKAINKAYRQLADFYRKHGVLPLTSTAAWTAPSRTRQSPRHASDASAPYRPERKKQQHFASARPMVMRAAIAVWVLLAAYLVIDAAVPPGQIAEPERITAAVEHSQGKARPTTAGDPEGYFTIGSTPGEVYAAQGIPSHTEDDIWHYGTSKIYFARGKVIRWEETKEHPLRAQLGVYTVPRPELSYFSRGSTKAEVRRAQGTPVRETDRVWDYGVSRVYFEGDRVVGWNESPVNPLKAK